MMSCLLFSCDSSDDCALDDWLGTYRGVKTCGIEVQDDYVFSIVRDNLFTGINTSSEIGSVRIIVDGEFFFFSETQCSITGCLLYTSPSPRDGLLSRMPSSA